MIISLKVYVEGTGDIHSYEAQRTNIAGFDVMTHKSRTVASAAFSFRAAREKSAIPLLRKLAAEIIGRGTYRKKKG